MIGARWPPSQTAPGQTLVLFALLLSLLVVPLGITVLAVNAQRDAVTQLQGIAQGAAFDAAHALDDAALASGGLPRLASLHADGGTFQMDAATLATYSTPTAQATAEYRAYRDLRRGFTGYGRRIDALAEAAGARITLLDAADDQPAADPDGGALYHHPTVCISADVLVGVLEHEGLAFRHHLHACAQSSAP